MLALLALQMQVHYALDLPNLRRGRKRKSADPDDEESTAPRFNDWTHEEDVKLWSLVRRVQEEIVAHQEAALNESRRAARPRFTGRCPYHQQ